MKKFSTIFAILLISSQLFGQAGKTNDKNSRFGFRASSNLAWIKSTDKNLMNNGARLCFSYGFNFQEKIKSTLWYEIGMDVSRIDGKLINKYNQSFVNLSTNDTIMNNNTSYVLKLNYMEIPFSFVGKTDEIGYMTYTFQGGVTPGFLLSQNTVMKNDSMAEFTGKLNSNRPDDYVAKSDDIGFFRMGFVLGAGVEYALTKKVSVVGNLRYNNGLFRINKNKAYDSFRNNYVALSVGILF